MSFDTTYAVKQHEDLTLQHDAGRQAKYLEQPLNQAKADTSLAEIIANEVEREL